jgi:hypothetical protein
MAIIIPSLIHAACHVSLEEADPKLISGIGVVSVKRTYGSSAGAYDVKLEQPVDPKTALLFASVNGSAGAPPAIQAVMNDGDPSVVYVYATQQVIASGNLYGEGAVGSTFGFTAAARVAKGEYEFQLETTLKVQNNTYADATIVVTPCASATMAFWNVVDEKRFKVFLQTVDGEGTDGPFSVVVLPNGQLSADCDFSLMVADLSAAGVVAA